MKSGAFHAAEWRSADRRSADRRGGRIFDIVFNIFPINFRWQEVGSWIRPLMIRKTSPPTLPLFIYLANLKQAAGKSN